MVGTNIVRLLQKSLVIIILLVLIFPFGCKKESEGEKLEIIDTVLVELTGPTSVEISWETNLPSNSVVYYGLNEALGDTVIDEEERERHLVELTGLDPDTIYYYQVESSSEHFRGNPRSELDQFETSMNEVSYTVLGWSYFSQEEYIDALSSFSSAISMNSGYGPAYIGRGWTYLRMEDFDTAIGDFDSGLGLDITLLEGYVGRSFIYLSQQKYSEAITDAQTVINADSTYEFEYNSSINHIMVRLVLAEAYYATQQYELAQEQCNVVDPENGLDSVLPETWVVNGTTYSTYLEALLALIQFLVAQYM